MLIANPGYNVVFKYLFDDEKVARLMLSALLGKEVLGLQARPSDAHLVPLRPDGAQLLVLRMDFLATVRLGSGGHQPVLIELRKARSAQEVQRFRRYLGSSYASPENVYLDQDGKKRALPIATIYFLREGLDCLDVPVFNINQHFLDAATGKEARSTDPFVEATIHNAIVVQSNRLKYRRRNELERLLGVFDQDQAAQGDPHLLDILEEDVPEGQWEVMRRLMRAGAEQEVLNGMAMEDDMLVAFQELDAAERRQALAGKDPAREAKDGLIAGLKGRRTLV